MIEQLINRAQRCLASCTTVRALTLSLMIALPAQTFAQEAGGLTGLIKQLEDGNLFGRIIERTPGNYVVVPDSPKLPAVRILNPERVAPASIGVNLFFNATYDSEERGLRLDDYGLSTLKPEGNRSQVSIGSANNAIVGGDTNTRVGAILQNNVGIANRNEAEVSPVSTPGKGDDTKIISRGGTVLQNNVSIGNKNSSHINVGVSPTMKPPDPVTRALTTFRGKVNDALKPGALPVEQISPDKDSSVTRAARKVETELNLLYVDAVEQGEAGLTDRNAAVRGLAEVRQELKSIYGTIDNYPPWSYERISTNAKSVVAIAEPGQTSQALCSGVLIAPDLVLTAGHCFRDHHPEDLEIWFGFAESADQIPLNPVAKTIVELVAPPQPLHDDFLDRAAHDDFDAAMPDFAIVRFDTTGDQGEIATLNPQCLRRHHIRRNKAIYVIGYPKGTRETVHDNARIYLPFSLRPREFEKLKQDIEVDFVMLEEQERIKLMADFVASYVPRGEGSNKVFELYDTRWGSQPKVGIVADLFRGNSGSPVFDRNNHCIVGIHTGGVSDTGLRLGATWQTHETVLPIPAIIGQLEQHADTLPLIETGTLDLR